MFKQLLESSQQQLKQQQELIAAQLQKHEHKKSQKKQQKLLKQQQLHLQFQIQQQIQLQQHQILLNQQQQQYQQQSSNTTTSTSATTANTTNTSVDVQASTSKAATSYPNVFFPPAPASPAPNLHNSTSQLYNTLINNLTPVIVPPTPNTAALLAGTPRTPLPQPAQTPSGPIRCDIAECGKTFRKQSLLDYHLKYQHNNQLANLAVVNNNNNSIEQQQQQRRLSTNSNQPQTQTPKRKLNSTSSTSTSTTTTTTNGSSSSSAIKKSTATCDYREGDEPYEVIYCTCGEHTSEGFMIQCEICLCWQHGDCVGVKSAKSPEADNYLCWICRVPGNKLKQLKYQNWMSGGQTNDTGTGTGITKNRKNSVDVVIDADATSAEKLALLNECSRKYYNLNLLMYTLEYQMSLFHQLQSNEEEKENERRRKQTPKRQTDEDDDKADNSVGAVVAEEADDGVADLNDDERDEEENENESDAHDDEEERKSFDRIEKLMHNIAHLQMCLNKKFNEFNSKIDEFEHKYKCDDASFLSRNLNLKDLHGKLQTIMCSNGASVGSG